MSFRSTFTSALEADIATRLSLDSADVYVGLEPRETPKEGSPEVWVEHRGHEAVGRGSGDGSKLHLFTLHLLLRDQASPQQTWEAHYTTLEGHAETLIDAYNGAAPFVSTIPTVIQAKASQGEAVVPADEREQLDVPVLLEVQEQ